METELLQLGGVFILAYGLLELLKLIIVPMVNKVFKNGNGKTKIALMERDIETFNTNHLKHQKEIVEFMKEDRAWKKNIEQVILKIKIKLGID